jgi:EAL domain-containing protein (putative c-di-GMP-specific phosphodiesterase class I)
MNFSEEDLARAIDREEFVPYFQPLVDLGSGAIVGFEVLARWPHPSLGLLPPKDFIQALEHRRWINGLSVSLLKKAFAAARLIPPTVGLSINISPLQLLDASLPDLLSGLAHEAAFDLRRLTIEVTESALLHDLDLAASVARELKLRGMRLSLDDFGTGYSSLLHLQAMPFDELKVDAGFVRSMASNRHSRKITASVLGLGQSLGLRTVGEGIEELAHAEMLMWQGCDIGQGWLYGRPMPADYLPSFMAQQVLASEATGLPKPESKNVPISLEAHPTDRLPQLRAIYEGLPIGLAFLDRDFRYVNINQRLADIHGTTIQAHLGRKAKHVIAQVYSQVEPYLLLALDGEATAAARIVKPSNLPALPSTDLIASFYPVRDEAGEVIGISKTVLDVSVTLPFMHSAKQAVNRPQSRKLFPSLPWEIDTEEVLSKASTAFQKISQAYRT